MDLIIFIIFVTGIAIFMLMDYQLGLNASRQPPSLQEERMQCVWTMVAGALVCLPSPRASMPSVDQVTV
jgi:hypothetical protein